MAPSQSVQAVIGSMSNDPEQQRQARQRKAARRTVWILALVSAGFYVVFFLEHWFFH